MCQLQRSLFRRAAGKMHTDSGRLSSAQGRKIEGEMESMMDEIFPGFGALFGLSEPPPRAAPPPRPQDKSQHACAAELTECSELLGGDIQDDDLKANSKWNCFYWGFGL